MNRNRFEELLGGLLDGELSSDEMSELVALAEEHPPFREEIRLQLESAEMITLAEDGLRDATLFVSAIRNRLDGDAFVSKVRSGIRGRSFRAPRVFIPWSIAAAAVFALCLVGLLIWQSEKADTIATLVESNGAVRWTGDGGQVTAVPEPGMRLGGGNLSSLSADSWATLKFNDGSTVTISGQSDLTLSENEQKELRLAGGTLSATVVPQPEGRPMLVYTPAADLQVVGTAFDVTAQKAMTSLIVTEGVVRTTRLSDQSVVEVSADQQVVATVQSDAPLQAVPLPDSVKAWESSLPDGIIHGQWLPELAGRVVGLRGTPHVRRGGGQEATVVYEAAGAVSQDLRVVLDSNASLRLRGRSDSPAELTIGLTVRHPKGGFAGKYVATRRVVSPTPENGFFDLEVPLTELAPVQPLFPDSAAGLELSDWWCSTTGVDAGLSIFAVELNPID